MWKIAQINQNSEYWHLDYHSEKKHPLIICDSINKKVDDILYVEKILKEVFFELTWDIFPENISSDELKKICKKFIWMSREQVKEWFKELIAW